MLSLFNRILGAPEEIALELTKDDGSTELQRVPISETTLSVSYYFSFWVVASRVAFHRS